MSVLSAATTSGGTGAFGLGVEQGFRRDTGGVGGLVDTEFGTVACAIEPLPERRRRRLRRAQHQFVVAPPDGAERKHHGWGAAGVARGVGRHRLELAQVSQDRRGPLGEIRFRRAG